MNIVYLPIIGCASSSTLPPADSSAIMLRRLWMFPCSVALSLALACDSSAPPPSAKADAKADPEAKAKTRPVAAPATPPPLPPAPEGAVTIKGVYVQTCAPPHACPSLLQDAGAAHCAGLKLGALRWRLPTLKELEAWRGHDQLAGYDVFHWSGSAWEEDPAQWWIYDPGSGSKTTAKPDRKPFTIRCAAQPGGAP